MVIDPKTGYFTDGSRKIHYVIALRERYLPALQKYIEQLNSQGLNTEIAPGTKARVIFVLIHLPKASIDRYSKEFNIGRENPKTEKYAQMDFWKNYHFKKLPSFINRGTKGEFTTANCAIIINKILDHTSYGDGQFEVGIIKLKTERIIIDSFPLHDGPLNLRFVINERTASQCNDRELLYRYWTSFKVWQYEIPLELIKKYYGHEVAFYYRWLEYFNLMLLPLAIVGLLVFIINLILLYTQEIPTVNEICEADNMYICPDCYLHTFCNYRQISEYCDVAKWTYVFDNYLTVTFAVLISFWGTFFVNVWKRITNELRLKWDLHAQSIDQNVRIPYAESVKRQRYNSITGEMEPCLTPLERIMRRVVSITVCLLMVLFNVSVILIIFYFEVILKMYFLTTTRTKHLTKIERKGRIFILCSLLQVVIVKINAGTIPRLTSWLTDFEMPKTQGDHDKSLLYKRYMLSVANNYIVLFYTALVKGYLYAAPNHPSKMMIEKDTCQPLACTIDLTSQLFFLLLLRRLIWNFIKLIHREATKPIRKWWFVHREEDIPQYEQEYLLMPTSRNMFHKQHYYNEMIIVYGFVTLFGAAFPLAPLIALIDNFLDMRISGRILVTKFRRPIPKVVTGIGPWEGILMGLMYISTAINAFVIAFSTQFVSKEVFRRNYNTQLHGFINYTLSEFATKDNSAYEMIEAKSDVCYYSGMHEPPSSENKYSNTTEYWEIFTWRMVFIVIFEHIVLMLNALLSFSIRDIPLIVREQIAYDRQVIKENDIKLTKNQQDTMFLRYRGKKSK